jgi:hypothetical protein
MRAPPKPTSIRLVQGTEQYRYNCIRKTLDLYRNCVDITDQELVAGAIRAFVKSLLEVETRGCGVEAKIPRLGGTVIKAVRCVPMPDKSVDASVAVECFGVLGRMRRCAICDSRWRVVNKVIALDGRYFANILLHPGKAV